MPSLEMPRIQLGIFKTMVIIAYTVNTVNPRLEVDLYYKSASIRGQAIGGSVQALIIGKILNPSKLPYLDHYELIEMKHVALEITIFEIPLLQV